MQLTGLACLSSSDSGLIKCLNPGPSSQVASCWALSLGSDGWFPWQLVTAALVVPLLPLLDSVLLSYCLEASFAIIGYSKQSSPDQTAGAPLY